MQTEKMMILKMLEEGKITAEEASRLLESGASSPAQTPKPASTPKGSYIPGSQTPPKSTESTVDSMGRKIDAFVKEMEPKIKKATKVVVEKTAGAAESISKSLSSHGSRPSAPIASPQVPKAPPKPTGSTSGIEEMVEIFVTEKNGELNLTGLNGQVLVKGYNGDKISAKIFTVAKRQGAKAVLAVLGNKYYLSYDENDFERVCIDAFVPEAMFSNIKVSTINGDISLSTITTSGVQTECINGSMEIVGVKAETMTAEANNGTLTIKETTANTAQIENFNGNISVNKIDIANLKANTFNGAIDMQIAAFANHDNYKWNIETGNGKLTVILPTYATLGYHIKAHAALDTVKLGLTSMNYIRNEKSFAEAKSANYDSSLKKVELDLATSNAPLIIN